MAIKAIRVTTASHSVAGSLGSATSSTERRVHLTKQHPIGCAPIKKETHMNGIALGLAVLATSFLYVAYVEFRDENRRDARLLAGFGGSGALASASVFLL